MSEAKQSLHLNDMQHCTKVERNVSFSSKEADSNVYIGVLLQDAKLGSLLVLALQSLINDSPPYRYWQPFQTTAGLERTDVGSNLLIFKTVVAKRN